MAWNINAVNGNISTHLEKWAKREFWKQNTNAITFDIPEAGEYTLKIGTIPNHDVDGAGMKIEILLKDKTVGEQNYCVEERSETWKQNVLRGQAICSVKLNIERSGE